MIGCLTIETVRSVTAYKPSIFYEASSLHFGGLIVYSRGFDDFSLCLFFLRDSSNVPQVQLPLETKVSLLAIPSNVSECKEGPSRKSLRAGFSHIYKLLLLCGVSVELAGKIPRCNVSQEQTCRLEQVLATLARGMV